MTTAFNSSRVQLIAGKRGGSENKKLSLFSPVILVGLLAIVFTFFLTASGETGFSKDSVNGARLHRTGMTNELGRSDSEMLYQGIVTNGDAIRSVLQ